MSTKENLKEAFSGESQANRRYLAYSRAAGLEGFPEVAKLFFAAAEAETVHALSHLHAMGDAKNTEENLKKAIEGESHEFESMYPKFVEEAKKEGQERAERNFRYALAVERIHHKLYTEALEAVKHGKDLEEHDYYVCTVCGNTVRDNVPDVCPICKHRKEKFRKVHR